MSNEQRAKNREQRAKSKEQRTESKERRVLLTLLFVICYLTLFVLVSVVRGKNCGKPVVAEGRQKQ